MVIKDLRVTPPKDHKVYLVDRTQGLRDHKETRHKVRKDLKDPKDLKVIKDLLGIRHKVQSDLKEIQHKDQEVGKEMLTQDQRDHKVTKAVKVLKVRKDLQLQKVLKVSKDLPPLQVLRVIKGL